MTLHEPTEAQILEIMKELELPTETRTRVEGLLVRDEKGRARAQLLEHARSKFFAEPDSFASYRARLGYTEKEGRTCWERFSQNMAGK